MTGISIADGGFELLCNGERIGRRRHLDDATVKTLNGFSARYAALLDRDDETSAELLVLGRDLTRFLDGDGRDLAMLLDRATRPLHFEIATSSKRPLDTERALLRAPWELMANDDGFLAVDVGLGFSPTRRLGRPTTPPALDRYRLGLVFMAAAPRGAHELDFEAEETAIMTAVGKTALDLLVEESGNPDLLAERIDELPSMQALHLNCHGTNDPHPALLLEDEGGDAQPTTAAALIETLRAHRPRFLFLSACLTAASAPVAGGTTQRPRRRGTLAQSLAEQMVDSGVPAVLGWDGSVGDAAAIAFAKSLYDGLAGRKTPPDAVATARRTLLNAPQDDPRRHDWHLARLWLGPEGGGAVVGGRDKRSMLPATHGEKEFLVKARRQVPVASHEMFVGRRRELQAALKALRDGEHAGVLLHGMGRLGKSSLAARIANRRPDLKLAVVFEHYGALDILAALREALRHHRAASEAIDAAERRVRDDSSRLESELRWLLAGPCARMGAEGTAVLLVIDDLEQIMEEDVRQQRYVVSEQAAPVLRVVLEAFDPTAGDSRLLLTSRYRLYLDGLEDKLLSLPLPPLSAAAQGKLMDRQQLAVQSGPTEKVRAEGGKLLDERADLLARVPGIARGNPGLQDLIGRKLVLSRAVTSEHAVKVLVEMEAWLAQGELPSDAQVREFLENLTIDQLIALAGDDGRALLRRLTVFSLPVPEAVIETMADKMGASLVQLRDLGLVDRHEDVVDPHVPAVAANALAAARVAALDEEEQRAVARQATQDLFTAWGGAPAETDWPSVCDLQLTQLGLLAENAEIVATCTAAAVRTLRGGSAKNAAAVGQAAIELLDARQRTVPWRLLRATAQAAETSGDGSTADTLIARGVQALAQQRASDTLVDAMEAALLLRAHADRLVTRGDLDEALRIYKEEELPVFERLDDVRQRMVTMGKIADILESRGDLDDALRIRREEQLPVSERLADVHARAVTMGQIADILETRGDLDEALRIRREQLPVYERVGNARERAVTLRKIADIDRKRGRVDDALKGYKIASDLIKPLGLAQDFAVFQSLIAEILIGRSEFDEARVLLDDCLQVYRRLEDAEGIASALWGLARIDFYEGEAGKADKVLSHVVEAYNIVLRLGRAEGIAVIGLTYGQILAAVNKPDEALAVLQRSAEMFRKLGQEDNAQQAERFIAELGLG
jgi:tetratricopeptide (TPR) repeat protein